MLGLLDQGRTEPNGLSRITSPESLSSQELSPAEAPTAGPLSTEAWIAESLAKESENPASEFELVVGRRQIATWMFLGLIVVALTATVAYLAGKSAKTGTVMSASQITPAAGKQSESQPSANQTQAPGAEGSTPIATSGNGTSLPQAGIMRIPTFGNQTVNTKAPLFAEPEIGKIYLQIGAVSKGMAIILSEGLRSHGFDSFVAPGPSVAVFRVLIGPLKDPDAFNRAKAEIDSIELGSFVRKYEKTANEEKPVAVALPSPPPSPPSNSQ